MAVSPREPIGSDLLQNSKVWDNLKLLPIPVKLACQEYALLKKLVLTCMQEEDNLKKKHIENFGFVM